MTSNIDTYDLLGDIDYILHGDDPLNEKWAEIQDVCRWAIIANSKLRKLTAPAAEDTSGYYKFINNRDGNPIIMWWSEAPPDTRAWQKVEVKEDGN
jgi:hypothetical protein